MAKKWVKKYTEVISGPGSKSLLPEKGKVKNKGKNVKIANGVQKEVEPLIKEIKASILSKHTRRFFPTTLCKFRHFQLETSAWICVRRRNGAIFRRRNPPL